MPTAKHPINFADIATFCEQFPQRKIDIGESEVGGERYFGGAVLLIGEA